MPQAEQKVQAIYIFFLTLIIHLVHSTLSFTHFTKYPREIESFFHKGPCISAQAKYFYKTVTFSSPDICFHSKIKWLAIQNENKERSLSEPEKQAMYIL